MLDYLVKLTKDGDEMRPDVTSSCAPSFRRSRYSCRSLDRVLVLTTTLNLAADALGVGRGLKHGVNVNRRSQHLVFARPYFFSPDKQESESNSGSLSGPVPGCPAQQAGSPSSFHNNGAFRKKFFLETWDAGCGLQLITTMTAGRIFFCEWHGLLAGHVQKHTRQAFYHNNHGRHFHWTWDSQQRGLEWKFWKDWRCPVRRLRQRRFDDLL